MSIKLGNLDVESFKVGSGDCSIYLGTTLLYSGGTPPAPHDYSQDYLTFRALEDGTFKFSGNSINYSTDSGVTWTELASDTDSPTVNSGNTILWKASLTGNSSNGIGTFSSSGRFEVEGNTMSLKFGDNFSGQTTFSDNYSLKILFNGCSGMTNAENTVLPATNSTSNCYEGMFGGCTSLTTAPSVLPATSLAFGCYSTMFASCSSLTKAPTISATSIGNYSCQQMFRDCSSLTTAPELLATTLGNNCYSSMFMNCTSLTTAQSVLPATTLKQYCYQQMFINCSSLTTAPILPATTLANRCYQLMFYYCTSLNSITCLATDISANGCTYQWVLGVQTSSGTFTKAESMASWGSGRDGIPNNWTVQDYSS